MRLFDLHCDTLYEWYRDHGSLFSGNTHVLPEKGDLFVSYIQVFAAWISDDVRGDAAWERCLSMLRLLQDANRERPRHITTGEDLRVLPSASCVALAAVENGAALGGDDKRIAILAKMGVKYITITWNGENELGYGSLSGSEKGLKPFGKTAVREMERREIVPDVSHLNERGFWDVAEICERPFIASHSLSRAVQSHPRNLTDAQFDEIVRRKGLVGLSFAKAHLGEQSFERIERHLVHYLSRGGADTVAFGGDLDGTKLPSEWNGTEVFLRLQEHFLKKGYSETLLDKIFYKNALEFFTKL